MSTNAIGTGIMFLHSPSIHVCFRARLTQDFSDEQYRAAAIAVQRRHPVLRRVIARGKDGYCFAKGGKVSLEFPADADWKAWYARTDAIPFDFEHGPLLKIAVLRGNGGADLVLLGHHILGDGLGFLNLLRDFLAALNGTLPGEAQELPEDNTLKKKPDLQLKLTAALVNRKWRQHPTLFTREDALALFRDYRAQNPAGMFLAEESEEWLQALRRRCKAEGLTVNEAIARAFVRALQQQNGGQPVRLGCACSLRGNMRTPVDGAMGNFVSGVSAKVSSCEETPAVLRGKLSGNLPAVGLQMLHLLDPGLVAAVPFAAYGSFRNWAAQQVAEGAREGTADRSFGLSNLGAQPLGALSFGVEGVWFIPPAFPQSYLVCGVLSCGGGIRFCLRYLEHVLTAAQAEEIYRSAAAALAEESPESLK
ncbi:MAG: condensation domain-containing protein [Oscillospiraceae bacterium]|nr:condensation domain-containing protein [Oscillospiraceae bacterium]